MAWWSGTVTATNGSPNVTVVSGDPIDNLVSGNALIIGSSFNPVEIKRAYFNGTNNIIELVSAWSNATQTSQPAKSFTTDADLIPISKTLATYLNSFTKASQTDAVTGTDNNNLMTPLRTKEAVQALVKSAAYLNATMGRLDHTLGRVFKMGDLGMGCTLDLRTSAGGAYADYDTPQKCYNKGTLFGFIDGASLGIPNYSASAYGVLTIHGHYTDASGAMGTCQEFRYGADVWIRAYASATTWTTWTKLLKTGDLGSAALLTATTSETDRTAGRALRVGDHGNGTTFRGRVDVLGGQTPAQIVALHGEGFIYDGTIQNHGGATPEAWGIISGYITSGNAYSYTYQEFTGINAGKWRRNATGADTWTTWRKVLEQGDFGIGATGNTNVYSGDIAAINATGLYSGGPSTTGGPAGVSLDGAKIWHLKWADSNSATQVVYTYSGSSYSRNITGGVLLAWGKILQESDVGSASFLTATTSTTDSTQGRAMRVGDHGLGGGNPQKNNWASMGAFTQFVTMSIPENAPDDINLGGNWWHIIRMQSDNTPAGALALKTHFSGGFPMAYPELWLQNADPSSLGYKARVYSNRNALGTVEFSGGVNTGAIIERGSNANGEYTKYADGTMVCWGTPLATATVLSNASVGAHGWSYYADNNLISFPAAFISPPSVQATPQGAFLSAVTTAIGVSSFLLIPITSISVATPSPLTYTATGRWRA